MEPEIKLSQKQAQRTILAPSLGQGLRILQLPILELKGYLENEIEENLFLEKAAEEQRQDSPKDQSSLSAGEEKQDAGAFEENLKRYLEAGYSLEPSGQEADEEKEFDKESLTARKPTLSEHLLHQLKMLELSEEESLIGEYLIDSLDENGYLRVSLEEITLRLQIDCARAQKLLSAIQGLEPYGIGARDLCECLLIQLKNRGRLESLAARIVKGHLADLQKKRYGAMAKNLKASSAEIACAVKEILALEPKPGRGFGPLEKVTIIPDIFLKKTEDDYRIELNDEELPRLKINSSYLKLLKDKKTPADTREFLKGKFNSALWLIKAIKDRRNTIRKVADCIINLQKQALSRGRGHLKPLTLEEVAKKTSLHISTISRVVNDKYIATPNGCLKLKEFFSGKFKSEKGGLFSADNLKSAIVKLVDSEDKGSPLSDQAIADFFKKQGIKVSRRTVVKYRNKLKVLPSYLRRSTWP